MSERPRALRKRTMGLVREPHCPEVQITIVGDLDLKAGGPPLVLQAELAHRMVPAAADNGVCRGPGHRGGALRVAAQLKPAAVLLGSRWRSLSGIILTPLCAGHARGLRLRSHSIPGRLRHRCTWRTHDLCVQ